MIVTALDIREIAFDMILDVYRNAAVLVIGAILMHNIIALDIYNHVAYVVVQP